MIERLETSFSSFWHLQMPAATETNAIGESMEPAPPVLDRATAMKTLSPLIFGHSAAMTFKTAVVLGIPNIIAKAGHEGTLFLREIAAQFPSDSVDEQTPSRSVYMGSSLPNEVQNLKKNPLSMG